MLREVFSLLPFNVCLCWLVTFVLGYRKADVSKRILTWFVGLCMVLYYCHALYFLGHESVAAECVWTCCTLAVYPVFYFYIKSLTLDKGLRWRDGLLLLPAVVTIPMMVLADGAVVDGVRKVLSVAVMLLVVILGWRRVVLYDRQLAEVYSEPEGRSLRPLRMLLVCFLLTSCCSAVFGSLGREYFHDHNALLVVPSTIFTVLLYLLFYLGYHRLTADINEELAGDSIPAPAACPMTAEVTHADDAATASTGSSEALGEMLRTLMEERKLYLQPDLKLGDVAREAGSCRTYVSNYINQELGMNFSDYVNRYRVAFARALMNAHATLTQQEVAEQSGFASVTSLRRNMAKFAATAKI